MEKRSQKTKTSNQKTIGSFLKSFLRFLPTPLTLITIILTLVITMELNPVWNSRGRIYHEQYSKLTTCLLKGYINLDCDDASAPYPANSFTINTDPSKTVYWVDPALSDLYNPYNPTLRANKNVFFYWDHAFYNNHYYMYFGVVPVLVLFLPLRLFGIWLTSTGATIIFSTLIVLAIFLLFHKLKNRLAPTLPRYLYLLLSSASSFIILHYAAARPALYCTAITSGICFMLWSFIFFYKAFIEKSHTTKNILLGGLFGALVFGCRPVIGFANLINIPLFLTYIRENNLPKKSTLKLLALSLLPYLLTAIPLCIYNYARFDSIFEFGQTYQLTSFDQSEYKIHGAVSSLFELIITSLNNLYFHFLSAESLSTTPPFIHDDALFIIFPLMLFSFFAFKKIHFPLAPSINSSQSSSSKSTQKLTPKIPEKNSTKKSSAKTSLPLALSPKNIVAPLSPSAFLDSLPSAILASILLIIVAQSYMSPYPLRRYTMDFSFLVAILAFLGICNLYQSPRFRSSSRLKILLISLSVLSIVTTLTIIYFVDTSDSCLICLPAEYFSSSY